MQKGAHLPDAGRYRHLTPKSKRLRTSCVTKFSSIIILHTCTTSLIYLHTVISTNVVGSKHEAKRQDRKFTWDFYE